MVVDKMHHQLTYKFKVNLLNAISTCLKRIPLSLANLLNVFIYTFLFALQNYKFVFKSEHHTKMV